MQINPPLPNRQRYFSQTPGRNCAVVFGLIGLDLAQIVRDSSTRVLVRKGTREEEDNVEKKGKHNIEVE